MTTLAKRVADLEGKGGATSIRYLWVQPEWTPSDIAAAEIEFRQERGIPATAEVCAIGWQPAQDKEGEQEQHGRQDPQE